MRSELPSLVGRDHLSFRSYYQPVRSVIDGDLCELYNSLDIAKKKSIADDLDRTPSEVRLRASSESIYTARRRLETMVDSSYITMTLCNKIHCIYTIVCR